MWGAVPRPTVRGLAGLTVVVGLIVAWCITGTRQLLPLIVASGMLLCLAPLVAVTRSRKAQKVVSLHAHTEPAAVCVGEPMHVVSLITNRSPEVNHNRVPPLLVPPILSMRLHRNGPRSTTVKPRTLAPTPTGMIPLPTPKAGHTDQLRTMVPTNSRGAFELPAQRSWIYDPLGLFGVVGPTWPSASWVVFPHPIAPVGDPNRHSGSTIGEGSSHSSGRGVGDLIGIRPYVPGDRLSQLHWPAKARYGTWFVRQFESESGAVVFVVDDRAGTHRQREFDRLVGVVLWIVDDVLDGGQAAEIRTVSGQGGVFEPNGSGHANVRLFLAELQPSHSSGMLTQGRGYPEGSTLITTKTGADRVSGTSLASAFTGTGVDGRASQVMIV